MMKIMLFGGVPSALSSGQPVTSQHTHSPYVHLEKLNRLLDINEINADCGQLFISFGVCLCMMTTAAEFTVGELSVG